MLFLFIAIAGCSFWERHQACEAARVSARSTWQAARHVFDEQADGSKRVAQTTAASAAAIDASLAQLLSASGANADGSVGEAAQDAFTNALKHGGNSAAEAAWTDYASRTHAAAEDAEHASVVVDTAVHRLDVWLTAETAWRVAGGYRAGAIDAGALGKNEFKATIPPFTLSLLAPTASNALGPPPAPPKEGEAPDPDVMTLREEAEAAADAHDHAEMAAEDIAKLAVRAERGGKVADAAFRAFAYSGFPPTANVALSASNEAKTASQHATSASEAADAAVAGVPARRAAVPPFDPAATAALDAARNATTAVDVACR